MKAVLAPPQGWTAVSAEHFLSQGWQQSQPCQPLPALTEHPFTHQGPITHPFPVKLLLTYLLTLTPQLSIAYF